MVTEVTLSAEAVGASRRATLAALEAGLLRRAPLLLLTGVDGVGKSHLCRQLLEHAPRYRITTLRPPYGDLDALLRQAAAAHGGDAATARFDGLVAAAHREGRDALLLVDDADALDDEVLERLLAHCATHVASPLLFLVGRPALRARVAGCALRPQPAVDVELPPLAADEVGPYVERRCAATVGEGAMPPFTVEALGRLIAHGQGLPRRLNTLVDTAQFLAALDGAPNVSAALVDAAAEQSLMALPPTTADDDSAQADGTATDAFPAASTGDALPVPDPAPTTPVDATAAAPVVFAPPPPPPPDYLVRRHARRHARRPRPGLVAAGVAAALVGAWLWWPASAPPPQQQVAGVAPATPAASSPLTAPSTAASATPAAEPAPPPAGSEAESAPEAESTMQVPLPAAGDETAATTPDDAAPGTSTVVRLLAQAERQRQAGRLSQPPGDNALESIRAAQALDPGNAYARLLLAQLVRDYLQRAFTAGTDTARARAALERARAIAPDSVDVREALARLDARRAPPPAATPPAPPSHAELFGAIREGRGDRLIAALQGGSPADAVDPRGRTALALAAELGRDEAVRLLLGRGARVDLRSANGDTALIAAGRGGSRAVLERLLDAGADVAARNAAGESALYTASRNGHAGMVGRLLDAGGQVDERDTAGRTPLMVAAGNGHAEVAALLLARGAAIDARTASGWTALMFAAAAGHEDVVWTLRAHGAATGLRNRDGDTAAALARARGHAALAGSL